MPIAILMFQKEIVICIYIYMDVSENNGTPKSSILIGFSIINHPFCGTPIFGNTHIFVLFIYTDADQKTLLTYNILDSNLDPRH